MMLRYRSLIGLVGASSVVTSIGVGIAYQFELAMLQVTTVATWTLLVGLVEEAFVRFIPLILVFYGWSYWQGQLLSKTEGLLATVASGLTVAVLELVLKLEFLSRLEATAQFDSLVLPLVFVHCRSHYLLGGSHTRSASGFTAPTRSGFRRPREESWRYSSSGISASR